MTHKLKSNQQKGLVAKQNPISSSDEMYFSTTNRRWLVIPFTFWSFIIYYQYTKTLNRRPIDPTYGLLSSTTSNYAIATFLSGDIPLDDDPYYTNARMLTYQLLHASETRCDPPFPFLVLCTTSVSVDKKDRLRRDGATIIEVSDVPLSWWIKTGVTRWKDQFTKLRLFKLVQFSRILFIDADTLLTGPIFSIFSEPGFAEPMKVNFSLTTQIKSDEAPLPAEFFFAARPDNAYAGERSHTYPPVYSGDSTPFSAGFWIAAPSKELFDYFMSVMRHWRRFDPHTMEQSLLNYAFRHEGPMPWKQISQKWSATWPNEADIRAGVVGLHEKAWKDDLNGTEELRTLYSLWKNRMEKFYDDADHWLPQERTKDR